jgi:hypothetical protein
LTAAHWSLTTLQLPPVPSLHRHLDHREEHADGGEKSLGTRDQFCSWQSMRRSSSAMRPPLPSPISPFICVFNTLKSLSTWAWTDVAWN